MKPTLVDEAFLAKMDACFAEVGYCPSVMWIPQSPQNGEIKPADRLAAMDRAEYWEPYASPGEWLQSAYVGYSATGAADDTIFHIHFLIWKTNRYVSRFTLKTHITSFYFIPDRVIEVDEPDDLKEKTRQYLAKVGVTRRVVPIIHENFGCYFTGGNTGPGPLFGITTAKKHVLPFRRGTEIETAWLFEMPDGRWICPVCEEPHLVKPPWFLSRNPATPWAELSGQRCPGCQAQYGVDDSLSDNHEVNQGSVWGKLQRKWLKRKSEKPPS